MGAGPMEEGAMAAPAESKSTSLGILGKPSFLRPLSVYKMCREKTQKGNEEPQSGLHYNVIPIHSICHF